MEPIRSVPYHPMTQSQGQCERWHQTMKNRLWLEHAYLPSGLEAHTGTFVGDYNHWRYHQSLQNLLPANAYFGEAESILRK